MSEYVDGFVIPIRKEKVEDYRKLAETAKAVWLEHGALDFRENVLEDTHPQFGISFVKLAGCGPDETVIFSWITYQSREHRDEVNAKALADPRLSCCMGDEDPVFDSNRMSFGGFSTLVRL